MFMGAALGQLLTFNSTGIDFAMTALFVTIFIEQWIEYKTHVPALAGMCSALLCLAVFKADNFILPTMVLTVAILVLLKPRLQKYVTLEQDVSGLKTKAELTAETDRESIRPEK